MNIFCNFFLYYYNDYYWTFLSVWYALTLHTFFFCYLYSQTSFPQWPTRPHRYTYLYKLCGNDDIIFNSDRIIMILMVTIVFLGVNHISSLADQLVTSQNKNHAHITLLIWFFVWKFDFLLQAMLESINVPLEKLKFVRGTEYQLNRWLKTSLN